MQHVEYRHSWRQIARAVIVAFAITLAFGMGARLVVRGVPPQVADLVTPRSQNGTVAASVPSPFTYSFQVAGTLEEAGSSDESTSPYWWLDSGAKLLIEDGVGKTIQGALGAEAWRVRYALSSAGDTDGGSRPQNLFRLVSRSEWDSVRVESSFRITGDNWSVSPNRNESNGLLLMSRYKNGDTLYYAGVRVDGHAVIKKKYEGVYYTMAETAVFDGEYENGKETNLLPHNEWLALRSETITNNDGSVTLRLFMHRENEEMWELLLSARDEGEFGGTPPITGPGHLGIRTDFMDVEFDDFRAERL